MKKFMLILPPVLGLLIGGLLLAGGWREYQEGKAIAWRGIAVQATVTGGSVHRQKVPHTHRLELEFTTAKGRRVCAQSIVSPQVYEQLRSLIYDSPRIGEFVTVYYLEDNPEVFAVGTRNDTRRLTIRPMVGGTLVLLASAAVLTNRVKNRTGRDSRRKARA